MKNSSAAIFLKHIISVLCSMTKAKSMAIRDKTNALKARLVVLSLLKNKKFSLGSIPEKIHAILGQQDRKRGEGHDDQSNAIVHYNASEPSSSTRTHMGGGHDDDRDYYSYYYNDSNDRYEVDSEHGGNKYPELTQSMFERAEEDEDEDDLDLGDPNGSVIDLVRNNKEAGGGDNHEEFKLEDEIDQVADLFILKFHKRMRLQKLESFKRYQEMLQRST